MPNIDTLLSLIQKIFPDETCTPENMADYLNRLAIKDIRSEQCHFAPIEPKQTKRSGTYAPEKIVSRFTSTTLLNEPYATFREMRQIRAPQGEYMTYYAEEFEIFYMQAQFMKNFTDDCNLCIPFDSYTATYAQMNDSQLRTYFTWRTKVRQGTIENTWPAYAFCYFSELLNDVGVKDAADAMEKLIEMWTVFRQYHDIIDRPVQIWIRDYYVSHKTQLTAEFSQYSSRFPVSCYEIDLEQLKKIKTGVWYDLNLLEDASSFKITNGAFYKAGNRRLIEGCACFVFQRLSTLFKTGGVDFRKLFFERSHQILYNLFPGAAHPDVISPPITVRLSDYETIKYRNGDWHRIYVNLNPYRPVVGYLLKLTEMKIRQHFGYRKNLKSPQLHTVENCFFKSEEYFTWPNLPPIDELKAWKRRTLAIMKSDDLEKTIDCAVSDYCRAEHIVVEGETFKSTNPVEIDLSKLKEIERDHAETVKKLVITDYDPPFPGWSASVGADEAAPISKNEEEIAPPHLNPLKSPNSALPFQTTETSTESADVTAPIPSNWNPSISPNSALPFQTTETSTESADVPASIQSNWNPSISPNSALPFQTTETSTESADVPAPIQSNWGSSISPNSAPSIPNPGEFPSEIPGIQELIASLSSESKAFLTAVLEGQAPSNGEILMERINEKALQTISDCLMGCEEGVPYVYCDYIDDLKASLGGK